MAARPMALRPKTPVPQQRSSERLPHAPTPQKPYGLILPNGQDYITQSYAKLNAIVDEAVAESPKPRWLVKVMRETLLRTHSDRCQHNYAAYQAHLEYVQNRQLSRQQKHLLRLAEMGQASALDLLRIRGMDAGYNAEELAKRSEAFRRVESTKYPTRFPKRITTDMEAEVDSARHRYDPNAKLHESPSEAKVRVAYKCVDEMQNPRALHIVRKRNIAEVMDADTGIRTSIVKKSGFLLLINSPSILPPELTEVAKLFTWEPEDFKDLSRHEEAQDAVEDPFLGFSPYGLVEQARYYEQSRQAGVKKPKYEDMVSERLANAGRVLEEAMTTIEDVDFMYPTSTSFYAHSVEPAPENYPVTSSRKYYPLDLGGVALSSL